jgi:3-isopropylmalate dehydrogenase
MSKTNDLRIALFAGDGIGLEITEPTCRLVERALEMAGGGLSLSFESLAGGAGAYRDSGEALPERSLAAARKADAIFLSAMGLPDIRYPDGTEITPQIDLRFALGLYAGVRPVRVIPGVPTPLADPRAQQIDFVLIRESIEGLFAPAGKSQQSGEREARETLVITREVSEKLFDFTLRLGAARQAQGRPGRVTCVDKANVFPAFAFFRKIFYERAAAFPSLACDHAYVDALALWMVKKPWEFDVLVTENMFGDILSDLGAGLMGGLGFAPSADIGDEHAVFQPCHGSAPDIAGRGWANPTAMILSGAMMLDWLGREKGEEACVRAGALLQGAVDAAFAGGGLTPFELGGQDGTQRIAEAVSASLETAARELA